MKKFLVPMLVALLVVAANLFAAEEQIVNLPQDQNMWYISAVGEKGQVYDNLLAKFDAGKLKTLKQQVHFCPVTTDTAIYAERYKNNVKGLPTVRVQEADGAIVYEASGEAINVSGDSLFLEIASAVKRRELLPWRRNHSRPQPQPSPQPQPIIPFVDPAPAPLNNGGAPDLGPLSVGPSETDIGIGICLVMVVLGVIAGEIAASKALHSEKK